MKIPKRRSKSKERERKRLQRSTLTEEKKKENMQNSGRRLSDTVCKVPLGPIEEWSGECRNKVKN